LSETLILLVGMRGLLGEIITETLVREPGLRIIGDHAEPDRVLPSQLAAADVVVVCLGEESSLSTDLALAGRHGRLILILDDGRRAALYGRGAPELPLEPLSPSSLLEAVRGPAGIGVAPT
jgi:hypothetical protein